MASSRSPRLDGTCAPWPRATCSGSWPSCTTANGLQQLQVRPSSVKHLKCSALKAPDCEFIASVCFISEHFRLQFSKDSGAPVVHGAADLQDHHHQQVQEAARAAHGLPKDVRLLVKASPDDLGTFSNPAAVFGFTGLRLWRTWTTSSCPKSLTQWRRCVHTPQIAYPEASRLWPLAMCPIFFPSGEIPGQRRHRSRRRRSKHVLHHPQRRGNFYLILHVIRYRHFFYRSAFFFRFWWLRMSTDTRSRSAGWEKGNISGSRPLYGNHGNRTLARWQLPGGCALPPLPCHSWNAQQQQIHLYPCKHGFKTVSVKTVQCLVSPLRPPVICPAFIAQVMTGTTRFQLFMTSLFSLYSRWQISTRWFDMCNVPFWLCREVLRTATCTADGPVTCFSIDKEWVWHLCVNTRAFVPLFTLKRWMVCGWINSCLLSF